MTLFAEPDSASAARAEIPEPATPKFTERDMLDLLARRYTRVTYGAHRYAFAEHVPNTPAYPSGIADFIAMDCWKGNYARTWDHNDWGYPIHGHEVKVSRSDWLTELRAPEKAEVFRPYCDFWWLVVPDASIVRDDLPAGWGLLVKQGDALRQTRPAKRIQRQPMPRPMNVALIRAIAKTARRSVGDIAERETSE